MFFLAAYNNYIRNPSACKHVDEIINLTIFEQEILDFNLNILSEFWFHRKNKVFCTLLINDLKLTDKNRVRQNKFLIKGSTTFESCKYIIKINTCLNNLVF